MKKSAEQYIYNAKHFLYDNIIGHIGRQYRMALWVQYYVIAAAAERAWSERSKAANLIQSICICRLEKIEILNNHNATQRAREQ